jgi:histidine triad (HIT) family protein
MTECIFCKVVNKDIPSEVIDETDEFIVFKDINPKAPTHVLVVTKKHIKSVNEIEEIDLAGKLITKGKEIAKKLGIDKGYKLVFNVGREGGQVIDHLHLHVLGGWSQETHKVEV